MKLDRQPSQFTVVSGTFVLPSPSAATPPAMNDACCEPPQAGSTTVDQARQPGLLGRLDALLNV